jgi:predicted peroxiredoxin
MAKYLLIESRDPFDSQDVRFSYDLARDLAQAGNDVTLFLVQNGVIPARPGAKSSGLSTVAAAGVEILADEFSLKERGIRADKLLDKVKASPIDVVVDRLAGGSKAIWH